MLSFKQVCQVFLMKLWLNEVCIQASIPALSTSLGERVKLKNSVNWCRKIFENKLFLIKGIVNSLFQ
ncbi:hypothetical protein ANANG_G00294060, partial [Anguilla anguilla]